MILNGGGQNIVQAGNNNPNVFKGAGNVLGSILATKLWKQKQDYMHNLSKDRITHQTNEKVRGNMVEAAASPLIMGHYFDYANQTLGADHPNVVNGVINPATRNPYQASDLKRPEFAHFVNNFGIQSGKYGLTPGSPSKGEAQEKARKERLEAFPQSSAGSRNSNLNNGMQEGKDASFRATDAAYKSGYITSEEAAATNPKFNTNYETYKSENPTYKGTSQAGIDTVHNKLDSMGN